MSIGVTEIPGEPEEAEKWEGTRAGSVTEDREDKGSPHLMLPRGHVG